MAARAACRWASGFRRGALWIALLVPVAWYGEAYFLSLAMLAFLAFWSADSAADRARWSPAVLGLSLVALMKLNFGVMAAALAGLMALVVLLERRCDPGRAKGAGGIAWRASGAAWPPRSLPARVDSRLRLACGSCTLDCTGRLQPGLILRTFEMGAAGVLVLGCGPGLCHYGQGNERAAAAGAQKN